jgi:hypothetical protein
MILLLAVMAATPDPELLRKLATDDQERRKITEGGEFRVEIDVDELDGTGAVTKKTHSKYAMSHSGGSPTAALLEHLVNGVDQRAAFEAEQKQTKNKPIEFKSGSPFGAKVQSLYRFELLPPAPDGLTRIAFQPSGDKSPDLLIGDAAVDSATGQLVRLSGRPSKLPSFVTAMSFEVEYGATPLGRLPSVLHIRGSGGFLFFKRTAKSTMRFSEYRAPSEKGALLP